MLSYVSLHDRRFYISYLSNTTKLYGASLIVQLVKNPPAMQVIPVRFLGWEDPLEKGKATHSSICFPCASAGKESTHNVGDLGSISGLGRSSGEGNSYPLQYSGLENSMARSFPSKKINTNIFVSWGNMWLVVYKDMNKPGYKPSEDWEVQSVQPK